MNTRAVESKSGAQDWEALRDEELLARGWAALHESYRIPEVAPTLDEARAVALDGGADARHFGQIHPSTDNQGEFLQSSSIAKPRPRGSRRNAGVA